MEQPKLYPYEWLAVVAIIAFIATISLTAYLREIDLPINNDAAADTIDVKVSGAVVNSRVLHVRKGALVKEILDEIELKPDADLSNLKLDKPLRQGQKVLIPSHFIHVTITGAVREAKVYVFPKKTKIRDISALLDLDPEADLSLFKSKRQLRDGEILVVPFKNEA